MMTLHKIVWIVMENVDNPIFKNTLIFKNLPSKWEAYS